MAGSLYSLHMSSVCEKKNQLFFFFNFQKMQVSEVFLEPVLWISSCSFLKLMTNDVRLKMYVYKDQSAGMGWGGGGWGGGGR